GENLFIVKDGVLYEPAVTSGLMGITRQTIIAIAADLGIPFRDKLMTRDDVYLADEAFFTGTAAEVTPIRELDDRTIGAGARGPITTRVQAAFFDIVNGRNPKYAHWLTKV
ncbi:MAG: aminotransferase class IV, partial [Betaproteobacteria bacterium]